MTTASPTITGTRTTLADRYVILPPSLFARTAQTCWRCFVRCGQLLQPAAAWLGPVLLTCVAWTFRVGGVLLLFLGPPALVIYGAVQGIKAIGSWLGLR